MTLKTPLVWLLLVISPILRAQSLDPESQLEQASMQRSALSVELVRLLGYASLFDNYLQQCTKSAGTYFDPKIAYASDPSSFGGLTPESNEWIEVERIYIRYQQRVCAYLTVDELTDFFAQAYATQLDIDELRAAIKFQESDLGRKLQKTSLSINKAYLSYAQERLRSLYQSEYAAAAVEMSVVIDKYRKKLGDGR